jgi:integrase
MAQIKKLGERRYLIRASKGTGRNRVYDNKVFDGTLAEAREEARDMEVLLAKGRLAGVRFEKCFELWLAAIKPKLAPRTVDGYDGSIRRYALDRLRTVKLGRIERGDIQKVYDDCGRSSTTIRNLHASLNAFFSWCVRRGDIKSNPCKHTDRPQRSRTEIQVLNPDEAFLFTETCRTMKNGIIFELALETGMRPEEYLALRWRDYDGTDIFIQQAVQFNRSGGGGYYFKELKTARSRRRISLSAGLRKRLLTHRREQNEHRLAMKGTWFNHDLIFPNEIGRPIEMSNLTRRYFRPIADACDLGKHITIYSLRHSCATLLLIQGYNAKIVADRLGHASVVLTLDTYSHVQPSLQADATNAMENVMRFKGTRL